MRGQFVASKRTKSKINAIFDILDPKNLYLDTHEAKTDTLNFDLSEVMGGQLVASERS